MKIKMVLSSKSFDDALSGRFFPLASRTGGTDLSCFSIFVPEEFRAHAYVSVTENLPLQNVSLLG